MSRLVVLLDRTAAWRVDLEELFQQEAWDVMHDGAQPTGHLVVDAGWGLEQGHGLLLFLDDTELVMLTGTLGPVDDNPLRGELVPAWLTASQRYGELRQVEGGAMWDTGSGDLLIAAEHGMAQATWVRHHYLPDPAPSNAAGLSQRMLETMVMKQAEDAAWPAAVTRATQLVPDELGIIDRWEATASVAIGVQVIAAELGLSPSQVRDEHLVEHVNSVLGRARRTPRN